MKFTSSILTDKCWFKFHIENQFVKIVENCFSDYFRYDRDYYDYYNYNNFGDRRDAVSHLT